MTATRATQLWGLVLAGGDGVRLQALTRTVAGAPIPKQYCRLAGDRSMLEATFARVAQMVPPARTLVVVNRDHLPLAAEQLRGLPAANALVQPRNCDTGPGLLFAALRLRMRCADATVAVFPSDHYIREDDRFLAAVARGVGLVERFPEKIVLLGMTPDRAAPDLGYLDVGRPPPGTEGEGVFHVQAFVEKPDPEDAERLLRRGGLWNSFVMLFRLETMLSLLAARRPLDYEALVPLDEAAYAGLAPWNFSRDFLAHVPHALLALQVDDVGWSDWGTVEAIERTLRSLNVVPPWRPAAEGEQPCDVPW